MISNRRRMESCDRTPAMGVNIAVEMNFLLVDTIREINKEVGVNTVAKWFLIIGVGFFLAACGNKEDSAKRDAEIKKVLEEGAQKERKMYEGVQKGMENMEKGVQEQKESK